MKSSLYIVTLLTLATTTGALAQIYSQPPLLQGQTSYHIFSVPGVSNECNFNKGTFFACTNTTDAPIRVGIEVFPGIGGAAVNDPSATSQVLGAGSSTRFVTSGSGDPCFFSSLPSINLSVPNGTHGSARILATSTKGIICTAFLGDPYTGLTDLMTSLTVVKKTKQKGD